VVGIKEIIEEDTRETAAVRQHPVYRTYQQMFLFLKELDSYLIQSFQFGAQLATRSWCK
jgi:hypothetical protein